MKECIVALIIIAIIYIIMDLVESIELRIKFKK